MGVDTRAILRRGVTIEEIEVAVKEKYTEVKVVPSSKDFMYVVFKDGSDQRQMVVSFSDGCERDYGIAGVWCSLGLWRNSVQIMRYLCETFGGYLDENDCDGDGFYPINFHLYSQGKESTELDLLKNEIIAKLGYDKLKITLELFEKFKNSAKKNKKQKINLHNKQ